jgi:hypothetical protein
MVQSRIHAKLDAQAPAHSHLGLAPFLHNWSGLATQLRSSCMDTEAYASMVVAKVLCKGRPPLHIGGGGSYAQTMLLAALPLPWKRWVNFKMLGMLPLDKAVATAAEERAKEAGSTA